MRAENLAVSAAMIIGCVLTHSLGIYGLMGALRSARDNRWRNGQAHHQAAAVVFTVFGRLLLHALQVAAYAWLYQALGHFTDVETAV